MIYLILDTNIWIYLANGFNPINEQYHKDEHFNLLNRLTELIDKEHVEVLINDIIINEWDRNKMSCYAKVEKLKKQLSQLKREKTFTLQKEEEITKQIKMNNEHILSVEMFIKNKCTHTKIKDTLKVKVFDLAINKKAPFHKQKNNVADCAILLSADEHVKSIGNYESSTIFISNNYKDFADEKDRFSFHPEILPLLNNNIKYKRALHEAIELSREIIIEIEEYNKYQDWLETVRFDCKTSLCQSQDNYTPWGYLNDKLRVKYSDTEETNLNQLLLFDLPQLEIEVKHVGHGECIFCNTRHIECPMCEELIPIDDESEEFICQSCKTKMEIVYPIKDEPYLFVNFSDDEVEE